MIDTTRIRTGFDVEIDLGSGWIRTALQTMADAHRLIPEDAPPPYRPDSNVTITSVTIMFNAIADIEVQAVVDGSDETIFALVSIETDDSGDTEIVLRILGFPDESRIPFDALEDLAGPPSMVKVQGAADIDPAFVVLANLDLRASPQSGEPLDPDLHAPRDEEPGLAQSFLPTGRDIAIGIGRDVFPRFANDAWHTTLRADDGSHPMPDEEDRRGEWTKVRFEPRTGGLRMTLFGKAPLDFFPDGTVTVTVDLTPRVEGGVLSFDLQIDTDVDTGLFGDLWAAFVGGFVGLLIGPLTGGLVDAGSGAILAVVALEIAEVVVEGEIRRQVRARLDEVPPGPVLTCSDEHLIVEAVPTPDDDHGIALGPLDGLPRSIPIDDFHPDPLHTAFLLVTTRYQEATADGSGFAAAGITEAGERFVPRTAALLRRTAVDGAAHLVYRTTDPDAEVEDGDPLPEVEVSLPLADVVDRAAAGALDPPLRLQPLPAEADLSRRDGTVPSVCLTPAAIRRRETVVTDIRFEGGLELTVPEAVDLQDAGAIVLRGLQLIHPKNARPYFRSFADATEENNFENLPTF